MNTQPVVRTQITLTVDIKRAIEAKKRLTGESLSAYLRNAALIRLMAEEEEQKELKRLANAVVGSVSLAKHPKWRTKKSVQSWISDLRIGWS